ncbi:bifunctional riboflavin kinase/FAD synthetase [Thermoactinomyces mirandus]|uniref:Riboflavin biosynthesis protein n=1 Tax=Thermoactinomyces mirandus TaxID=2756294 RepID=A0A7W2AS50_9BACL|nr:bifunctional riboflavin kinase/FAD synthetase [Thermoactinomyces mirandus]MBA4602091.1 bifunctional riboflavin kinase/FAD synthetase [Thermoactinomyces mirandus]
METIHLMYPLDQSINPESVSLAIGFFDGVHRGHQAVIKEAVSLAEELGVTPAVMTFDPHPREVLGKDSIRRYLTPLSEKLAQFARLGVKKAFVVRFDQNLSALSKEEFVAQFLLPLGAKGVVTGFNFSFGRAAEGKARDLVELGKGHFKTKIIDPIRQNGVAVSSTCLRQALAEGDMHTAWQILGRPYSLAGTVIRGDQRGRLMGYPTANLDLEMPYLVPRSGVYLVKASVDGAESYGLMNIGVRPTFSDPASRERLEVHLLERSGNFYDKQIRVCFYHFLREERKFRNMDALVEQIERDRQEADQWLRSLVE